MKVAAKVFLILGMVIFGVLIFPIPLGVIAIKRMDTVKHKYELEDWALISLFFVSLVGGILMLCIPESELVENPGRHPEEDNKEVVKPYEPRSPEYIEKMKALKEQLNNGEITEEEYKVLKAEEDTKGRN